MVEDAAPSPVDEALGAPAEIVGAAAGLTLGRRGFIAGSAVAAATAAVLATSSTSAHAQATAAYNKYVPLNPLRLCDTRPSFNFGYSSRSGKVTRIQIAGRTVDGVQVPANATAAVFTVVGINRSPQRNYLAAYPTSTAWSGTSSLNMPYLNAIVGNLVTVKLGNGSVDILSDSASDIIVDLAGVYVASDATEKEGRYQQVSPRRVLDTRTAGVKPGRDAVVRVDLSAQIGSGGLDVDAAAVSINLTAAQVTDDGYLTVYPFGEPVPQTSTLNVRRNENRAIGALVKLGRDDRGRPGFNVLVKNGSHVLIDVDGFITGPAANRSSGGLFVPLDPVRLMDTRGGQRGKKRLWPRWTRAFDLPPDIRSEAGTAVLNVTAVRTMSGGFFSVNAAQTRSGAPTTSSINVGGVNDTVANHVVSQASSAGLEVYSSNGGDVIADLVGYFKSSPVGATEPVPTDPPPPAVAPPYWTRVPSISRMNSGRNSVTGRFPTAVVDSGSLWHWTGTGFVGQGTYVAVFGHRTDAGGPFYYLDEVGSGDQAFLSTSDQRTYVYTYNRRELTSKDDGQILAATQRLDGETLSMIACTVGFDRFKSRFPDQWAPTSLEYRIIVTYTLDYWTDDVPLI
jgi:hypothetical protein